ncbi:hypothetical protein [Streptomyces sp. CB02261]|uniref:hypothetical protein n=1 Tax=Streptomyces sp. CB02261 TaxID=1703940 RepID=UPI000A45C663|nr:hypothetical protein [Streptomyces sp. CB02261]
MSTPSPDEFERMMNDQFNAPGHHYGPGPAATTAGMYDPNPYGPPAPAMPPIAAYAQAKPGLTKRGKVALSVGATVLAGGALIGYQSHTATVAENQARAKEMEVQAQLLRIEELKEINRANEINRNSMKTEEKTRQVSVDSCIDQDKKLVGKGMGSPSYREVIDNCLTRYSAQKDTTRFDAAASTTPVTNTSGGTNGDGLNGFLVLGIGAVAVLAFGAAKRGTRPADA